MSPHSDVTGDLSQVDEERARDCMWNIVVILSQDKDDFALAYELKKYVKETLQPNPELFIRVGDLLAEKQVLTRAQFKAWTGLDLQPDLSNGHFDDL